MTETFAEQIESLDQIYLKKVLTRLIIFAVCHFTLGAILLYSDLMVNDGTRSFLKWYYGLVAIAFIGYTTQLLLTQKPPLKFFGGLYLFLTIPLSILVSLPLKGYESKMAEIHFNHRHGDHKQHEKATVFTSPTPIHPKLNGLFGVTGIILSFINPELSKLFFIGVFCLVMAYVYSDTSAIAFYKNGKVAIKSQSKRVGTAVFHLDEINSFKQVQKQILIKYTPRNEKKIKTAVYAGTREDIARITENFL